MEFSPGLNCLGLDSRTQGGTPVLGSEKFLFANQVGLLYPSICEQAVSDRGIYLFR